MCPATSDWWVMLSRRRVQKVDVADLRDWVKERLPDYMVPVAWVEM